MNSIRKNISIRNVATAAGVSTAAVSKALNNKTDISAALRQKILTICDEMGYQVNSSIQDLVRKGRNGTTRNIAFILVKSEFADPAYARAIDGVARAAQKHGLHLILDNMRGDEKSVYDLPPILRDGRVDGIVLTGSINSDVICVLKELKVRYVILGTYSSIITDSSVNVLSDNRAIIELIVKTLKENGKKRIAYFTEAPGNYSEQEYLNFFMSALAENNLLLYDELIYCGTGPFSGAIKVMEKIFMQPSLPFDSIISINFRTAQEISHLVMAYYGIGKVPEITIGTCPPFSYYKLPVPAIYSEIHLDRIAYEGMNILNDIITGKIEYTSKKIMLSPEIEE